jgi:hypothetical protein
VTAWTAQQSRPNQWTWLNRRAANLKYSYEETVLRRLASRAFAPSRLIRYSVGAMVDSPRSMEEVHLLPLEER